MTPILAWLVGGGILAMFAHELGKAHAQRGPIGRPKPRLGPNVRQPLEFEPPEPLREASEWCPPPGWDPSNADRYQRQDHRKAAEWSLTGLFHKTRKPWGEPVLWHRDCLAAVRFLVTGETTGQMSFSEKEVFAEVKRVISIAGLSKGELASILGKCEELER